MKDYQDKNNGYEDDFYDEEYDERGSKTLKGYKIVIVLLVVVLGGLSAIYFRQVSQIKKEFAIERDTLTSRLTAVRSDFANLKTENDSISYNLGVERGRVDSLIEQLQNERRLSYAKIRRYENQLAGMRKVMQNYVHQIDSLNTLNRKLISENRTYKKEVESHKLRAEVAEEKAEELGTKDRIGAVVHARDIRLVPLSANDKEVTRASRAARLRVDFTLAANELTEPGERPVYVRITSPDGYVMANAQSASFNYEGDKIIYSATRDVDYQNQDLAVGVFYNGEGITGGEYRVEVYMDGNMIGSLKTILR